MSTIEIRLAPEVNRRRQEIYRLDATLRGLNENFPNERRKPDSEKNPEYHALRSGILARRRDLSGEQFQARSVLRQAK